MTIEWPLLFAPDKLWHFLASFALAAIDPAIAAMAGIAKEIWDGLGNGTPEWGDLVADALGILAAVLLF